MDKRVELTAKERHTALQIAGEIVSVQDIVEAVADLTGIAAKEIYSHSKDKPVVAARHAAMLLAHERGFSSNSIGRAMARDHSTVLHGISAALRKLKAQQKTKEQ